MVDENKRELAVVIHGFCRGSKDMQLWKSALEKHFYRVITPDLPTTYSSFDVCLRELTAQIAAEAPSGFDGIYFAGHSMGGLLARAYLQQEKPANAKRLVCVGTPHQGSFLADIALLLPWAGAVWKPLHALKRSARKTLISPEISGLEIGAIYSTVNRYWFGKLFLSKEADGMVEKFSAIPPDAKAVAKSDAAHIAMMFDLATAELVCRFLRNGTF